MTPTSHQEHTERELQTISNRTAVVSDAVDALADVLSVDEVADIVTAQIDAMLCSALGNATASRWWLKHMYEVCGNEALRAAQEAVGRDLSLHPCHGTVVGSQDFERHRARIFVNEV